MKKGRKIVLWIIWIILGIFIIGIGGVYIYGNHMFNKVEKVEVDKNDVGITEEVEEKLSRYSNSIINIALFGVDSADASTGRSDSIIISTIDTTHKKLKLTSVMRDSYVNISGIGNDKINQTTWWQKKD